jgi:hypothetical protein
MTAARLPLLFGINIDPAVGRERMPSPPPASPISTAST